MAVGRSFLRSGPISTYAAGITKCLLQSLDNLLLPRGSDHCLDFPVAFLKGFRALDLTDLKGQLCGRLLADLGMEVVKIEPPGGDPVRKMAPFIHFRDGGVLSTTFAHLNAGKASKVLDLNTEADCEAFRQLVASADVVLESSQPFGNLIHSIFRCESLNGRVELLHVGATMLITQPFRPIKSGE
jgi:hypothetical protein